MGLLFQATLALALMLWPVATGASEVVWTLSKKDGIMVKSIIPPLAATAVLDGHP